MKKNKKIKRKSIKRKPIKRKSIKRKSIQLLYKENKRNKFRKSSYF